MALINCSDTSKGTCPTISKVGIQYVASFPSLLIAVCNVTFTKCCVISTAEYDPSSKRTGSASFFISSLTALIADFLKERITASAVTAAAKTGSLIVLAVISKTSNSGFSLQAGGVSPSHLEYLHSAQDFANLGVCGIIPFSD